MVVRSLDEMNKQVATEVTVDDNSVVSIPAPYSVGICYITQGEGFDFPSLNLSKGFYYDVAASSSGVTVTSGIGADVNLVADVPLTGTTGTDGKVTIGLLDNDKTIYLENRAGFTSTFRITFI